MIWELTQIGIGELIRLYNSIKYKDIIYKINGLISQLKYMLENSEEKNFIRIKID